jgi:hypothetical protein
MLRRQSQLRSLKCAMAMITGGSLAQCFTSRVTPAKRSIRFLTHRSSPAIACYFAKHPAETVAFRRLAIFAFRHF